jgi:hypothetical protein
MEETRSGLNRTASIPDFSNENFRRICAIYFKTRMKKGANRTKNSGWSARLAEWVAEHDRLAPLGAGRNQINPAADLI